MISSAQFRIDVVICGADSGLYHKFWEGKRWSPGDTSFDKISAGTWVGQPVCISREPDHIDAFAVNTDGKLYYIALKNGTWQEPVSLGGSWTGPPAAINQGKDRVDILMIGLDGGSYHKKLDQTGFTPPGEDWTGRGGVCQAGVALAIGGPHALSVITLGPEGNVWLQAWDNEQPSGGPHWDNLGGNFSGLPSAVSQEGNSVHYFARSNKSALVHQAYNGKTWLPAETLGNDIISPPKAVSWGPNRLDVFAIAADRSLVHTYFIGSSWSGFNHIGGVCLTIDNIITPTPGRIDVFYRGVDSTIYHKWFDSEGWQPSLDEAQSLGVPNDASMATLIPITGASGPVHVRREISDMQVHHKEQFDLFIRAIAKLQAKPQTDSMSWYGIASIHGVPYIRWPFEEQEQPQDNEGGYCCHRSVLFPAWHRVYLLLLEQAVRAEAIEIAKEFTGALLRPRYENAAKSLRFPYWDWTINNSCLPRAVMYDHVAVAFGGPGGVVTFKKIPNPLLKYNFQDREMHKRHFIDGRPNDPNAPDQVWSNWMETMRCPDDDGISQHDVVDQQMSKQHWNIREQTYKVMTVNEYQPFATTGYESGTSNINNSQSLEGIHDNIHVLCGVDPTPLDGHMGDPMYAGFDPVFWLHHSNVDRMYSIWQALHPETHVEPQKAKETTIMYKEGTVQDQTTPLYPFRHRNGKFFTSPDVDSWDSIAKFGYTYPEIPTTYFDSNDPEGLRRYVGKTVIDLLGPEDPKAYPPVPDAAVEEANRMNALANKASAGTSYLEGRFQITPGNYPNFDLKAVHRREWLVNIQIENFAVDGSFFVHVFLGDFNPLPENWAQDPNLVGTHSTFSPAIGKTGCQNCIKDNQNNAVVSGGVALTVRLLKAEMKDLEPSSVEPYLKDNLHWRVQNSSGKWIKSEDIPSLVVTVSSTIVESPEDKSVLPLWGVPEISENVTHDKSGGYDVHAKL